MGHFVREWKSIFLTMLFIGLSCFNTSVQSVAAASEWPLGLPEEYTTAYINITYNIRNGSVVNERSQTGRFGRGGKIASVSGVVVHVKSIRNGTINHYGCDPIINEPKEEWIALIKRGMCDFELKLENAYAKKAVGMIVYDREESESLEDMKLSAYTIPGIFTYKSKGERIANLTDGGTRVDMHITVGEVCSRPYSGINRTSVLFVSISFIVLMIISLAWLVFYYVQRFRYLHAKDRLAQRLCNAAKKALAKIPTRNIKQTDKEVSGEGECCAVCIEFYKAGDMLRTLPCRHEFHKGCVDPWLLEHRTCPMCKMDILKYYGFIFTGSQESILHLDLEDGGLNSSDSRETESPTHDNHHNRHRNQVLHATTQQVESLSVSISPEESAVPSFSTQSSERKPSLISLVISSLSSTVVATANGCITATTNSPPIVISCPSDVTDGLIVTISEKDTPDKGHTSGCTSTTAILTMTTINDKKVQHENEDVCRQNEIPSHNTPDSGYNSSQPLLRAAKDAEATAPTKSSLNNQRKTSKSSMKENVLDEGCPLQSPTGSEDVTMSINSPLQSQSSSTPPDLAFVPSTPTD
ncbi:unnamed protein product [Orchesella dallaii]|uniref:RING-type domain-containing protein n=1 Tax=Orchesella dallaii TaxID=48710 RepID=A0ABP1PXY5_9HEXA